MRAQPSRSPTTAQTEVPQAQRHQRTQSGFPSPSTPQTQASKTPYTALWAAAKRGDIIGVKQVLQEAKRIGAQIRAEEHDLLNALTEIKEHGAHDMEHLVEEALQAADDAFMEEADYLVTQVGPQEMHRGSSIRVSSISSSTVTSTTPTHESLLESSGYQVCIGNLATTVTDSELREALSSRSTGLLSCRVSHRSGFRMNNTSCFGLALYASDRDALAALSSLNNTYLHDQRLLARETYQQELERDTCVSTLTRIFVGALHRDVTKRLLRQVFGSFGKIVDIEIVCGHEYGFINFRTHVAALAAISLMQDQQLCGQRVYLRWANAARNRCAERESGDARACDDEKSPASTKTSSTAASTTSIPASGFGVMKGVVGGLPIPRLRRVKPSESMERMFLISL